MHHKDQGDPNNYCEEQTIRHEIEDIHEKNILAQCELKDKLKPRSLGMYF